MITVIDHDQLNSVADWLLYASENAIPSPLKIQTEVPHT